MGQFLALRSTSRFEITGTVVVSPGAIFLERMRLISTIWMLVLLLCGSLGGYAQEAQTNGPSAVQVEAKHEEHGLSQKAEALRKDGGFVTNSMIISWIVALGLIAFARIATRNIKDVPSGAQNFWEWLVESLYDFLEGIIGPDLVKKTFWFFATIFIFILFTNWFGLIPGVGTIGWGEQGPHGFVVTRPLFRGGNADLNMTSAMAMIFMVLWLIWALQANGIGGFIGHLFGAKGESTGFLRVLLVVIFFLVGFLEIFSILFRPVSLSFRLYGNVFAGENMLEAMSSLVPGLGWLLPVPFYFMELLVGVVQALVFTLLTAVFTMLICLHDDEDHGKAHAPAEH